MKENRPKIRRDYKEIEEEAEIDAEKESEPGFLLRLP